MPDPATLQGYTFTRWDVPEVYGTTLCFLSVTGRDAVQEMCIGNQRQSKNAVGVSTSSEAVSLAFTDGSFFKAGRRGPPVASFAPLR